MNTLRPDAADQALEIFGLQAARRDRMVGCLAALFQDLDRAGRLLGDAADELGEQLASDQARARAGDEDAIRLEHVERGQVQIARSP